MSAPDRPVGDWQVVLVAHGTRTAAGNEVTRHLAEAVEARLGVPTVASYVELSEPLFADVAAAATLRTVVVPLLLSTGFHVRTDLPEAAAGASVEVVLGPQLGPDEALAQAQVVRLREAGAQPGQRVVLVAAGSSDEQATADQVGAVGLLARAWDGPVELATLSGLGTRPAEVVRPGDAVSPYLLSPGFFHDRIAREVPDGVLVADVIGPQELVVDLVCRRALELAGREDA
ncbi:sirohydrochlorin chelatase [Nocardioides litoris]|uniref:sirohydrochlorin chelatase n=1 Tax=Nocardioides litoris TaxID=1926648 RepID=UPI001476DC99|nr:CbiX/SirB N-terminal domain-containing protein [Nocardioides litoris]